MGSRLGKFDAARRQSISLSIFPLQTNIALSPSPLALPPERFGCAGGWVMQRV